MANMWPDSYSETTLCDVQGQNTRPTSKLAASPDLPIFSNMSSCLKRLKQLGRRRTDPSVMPEGSWEAHQTSQPWPKKSRVELPRFCRTSSAGSSCPGITFTVAWMVRKLLRRNWHKDSHVNIKTNLNARWQMSPLQRLWPSLANSQRQTINAALWCSSVYPTPPL